MNKLLKSIFIIICTLLMFSCSSNPNSTLNHSPKSVKENAKKSESIIDKDYGFANKDIVIFSTNDTLGAYNDNLKISSIKHFVDNFDKENNFITLVDTGNFSGGSEYSESSKGKSSIEIINLVGYDIVVPGSFEFNYGIDTFYDNMRGLKSNIVCCNIYDLRMKTYPFMPYVIYKYNDLKIAYVGVTSPEAILLKDNREYFFDDEGNQLLYFFEDETGEALYKQIQVAVDSAKEEGADKVILLSHLGIEGITEKWTTTKVIANTKDIDAVIDGHSMEVLDNGLMVNKVGSFIPIVQAGSRCSNVGAINITKDDYIYPAVMKDRSVSGMDLELQEEVDKLLKNTDS